MRGSLRSSHECHSHRPMLTPAAPSAAGKHRTAVCGIVAFLTKGDGSPTRQAHFVFVFCLRILSLYSVFTVFLPGLSLHSVVALRLTSCLCIPSSLMLHCLADGGLTTPVDCSKRHVLRSRAEILLALQDTGAADDQPEVVGRPVARGASSREATPATLAGSKRTWLASARGPCRSRSSASRQRSATSAVCPSAAQE
jgi:hypothetical protein